jgi:acyl-CoA synthetase (AMP-forming)/AMP-acid ligase II
MVDAGNSWRIQDGLYASLECQGGCQIDLERERLGHWRVSRAFYPTVIPDLTLRVPAVAASLLHSTELPKDRDFATVFYGGAPPSKQLAAEVKQRWPKAAMYVPLFCAVTDDSVQGYGMTETNAYVCSVAGVDYLERVSYFNTILRTS